MSKSQKKLGQVLKSGKKQTKFDTNKKYKQLEESKIFLTSKTLWGGK